MSHEIGWFTVVCIVILVCSCVLWAIISHRRALAKSRAEVGYTALDVFLFCLAASGFSFGLVGGILSWTNHSFIYSLVGASIIAGGACIAEFLACVFSSFQVSDEMSNVTQDRRPWIAYNFQGGIDRPSTSGARIQRHRFLSRHSPQHRKGHGSKKERPENKYKNKNKTNPKYAGFK